MVFVEVEAEAAAVAVVVLAVVEAVIVGFERQLLGWERTVST